MKQEIKIDLRAETTGFNEWYLKNAIHLPCSHKVAKAIWNSAIIGTMQAIQERYKEEGIDSEYKTKGQI